MFEVNRRRFLEFLGVTGGLAAAESVLPRGLFLTGSAEAQPVFGNFVTGPFTSVRLPHDLQWYVGNDSYLPTSATTGTTGDFAASLTTYTIYDDVVTPPEYERYVIASWGDNLFPNPEDYFGYNSDWTSYTPINATDGYLTNNHEYVSFPISLNAPEAPSTMIYTAGNVNNPPLTPPVSTTASPVLGFSLNLPPSPTASDLQSVWGEFMYNQGMSVVRISRGSNGRFAPVADAKNRRISGMSGLGANSRRTDTRADGTPYNTITSWGTKSYQQGDQNWLLATGPGAQFVYRKSTDQLGSRIIGTAYNCSGGYTPWGTSLSCEENFQGSPGAFFIGVQEWVKPDGTQVGYNFTTANTLTTYTTGAFFGLVGEKYGFAVEVDPADTSFRPRKHTALGRFRHENITLRVEAGKKLVAYMGDDRRAGHTWKYVSKGNVTTPTDKNNSNLFYNGTLYAARFDPPAVAGGATGTGRWIPLVPSTPVDPILPSVLGSQDTFYVNPDDASSSALVTKKLELPQRPAIPWVPADAPDYPVGTGYPLRVTPKNEVALIQAFKTKGGTKAQATLADYYDNQGAILMDCYLAANLAGGTPTGRPEDLEVNPNNHSEVFIAYTDGIPGDKRFAGEGYPDSRIFVVAKYGAEVNATQPPGGLYKITEDSADGTGLTFTWERFLQGGEDGAGTLPGAIECDGFAQIDNMAFDDAGNLWGVTDMSTGRHNGFRVEYDVTSGSKFMQPRTRTINHAVAGTGDTLVGTFGNNWLFCVPIAGADAGKVIPFGYGPPRCEMTGPTFVGDTLIISVQHPSEDSPINYDPSSTASGPTPVPPPADIGNPAVDNAWVNRSIQMLNLSGATFDQSRTLPRGSNFPSILPVADGGSGLPATSAPPPKPCVIGIRRKPV